MSDERHAVHLEHMIEAIAHIRALTQAGDFAAFEQDWRNRWAVERGFEIISEASRHLPAELTARYPEIAWRQIAGIGNVLRHDYAEVRARLLWNTARDHLARLDEVCRTELKRISQESREPPTGDARSLS